MAAVELQIGGFGGQGVILAGMIIGRGLCIHQNFHVSLTQSFGPEARGSACSVQLVFGKDPVLYPYISQPDILMTLSQDAYHRFAPNMRPGGVLIVEQDLVHANEFACAKQPGDFISVAGDSCLHAQLFRVPAMRLAEEAGRKMVLNVVLVGFFAAVTEYMTPEAGRLAVRESVPSGTEALNLAAFEKGYEFGRASLPAQVSLVGS